MKNKFLILFCFLIKLISFAQTTNDKKQELYKEQQLTSFLDSIGKLNPTKLVKKINQNSDSLFDKKQIVVRKVSNANMQNLKYHDRENLRRIDTEFFETLFGKLPKNLKDDNKELEFFHFGNKKNKYKEFAVKIGYHANCEIYFFKNNTIVGRHHYENKYSPNIKHFIDIDGKTVIYYKQDYDHGTGVWWSNTYFYKYSGSKIIPILNEINESNLSGYWGFRNISLETKIIKTKPLTIKMSYEQSLQDSLQNYVSIASGSTKISYRNKYDKLIGNYKDIQLSKNHISTYFTKPYTEILFINMHYKQLKKLLLDNKNKSVILYYLNQIKSFKSR